MVRYTFIVAKQCVKGVRLTQKLSELQKVKNLVDFYYFFLKEDIAFFYLGNIRKRPFPIFWRKQIFNIFFSYWVKGVWKWTRIFDLFSPRRFVDQLPSSMHVNIFDLIKNENRKAKNEEKIPPKFYLLSFSKFRNSHSMQPWMQNWPKKSFFWKLKKGKSCES